MVKQKFKLDTGPVTFTIIGISSHENDYRLSWSINEQLKLTLTRGDNLVTDTEKEFSSFVHEDDHQRLMLVSNRCDNGFLLEKHKNFDYILKFDPELNETETTEWLRNLKKSPLVSAVCVIPVNRQVLCLLG